MLQTAPPIFIRVGPFTENVANISRITHSESKPGTISVHLISEGTFILEGEHAQEFLQALEPFTYHIGQQNLNPGLDKAIYQELLKMVLEAGHYVMSTSWEFGPLHKLADFVRRWDAMEKRPE